MDLTLGGGARPILQGWNKVLVWRIVLDTPPVPRWS